MIDLDPRRWHSATSTGQLLFPEAANAPSEFALSVLRAIEAGQEVTSAAGGVIRFTATPALPRGLAIGMGDIRRLPPDQANSSIALGDALILKILRGLRPGIHPEIELGRYLAESGFAHIAALCGQVELLDLHGVPTALMLLHRFVPNQGTAANFMTEALERELRGEFLGHARPPNGLAPTLALAETIGRRCAGLHLALGRTSAEPSFGAETLRADDVRTASRRAGILLERGWAALEAAHRVAGEFDRRAIEELLTRRQEILHVLDEVPSLPEAAQKIRVHGDFHLGQILLTGDDVAIVDFEGEPGLSLEEARLKYSPLRDIAAMLRSFAYVAETAAREIGEFQPELEPALMARAREWQAKAAGAFLAGYEQVIGASPLWIRDRAAREGLLRRHMLQRALFELAYEASARPQFLAIPACGVLAALDEGVSA